MKERYASYKYNIVLFFLFLLLKFVQVSLLYYLGIIHENFALSMITAKSKNKSWIVLEYLTNNQNEKENILKIRKFVLFIYLLYCSIKNK